MKKILAISLIILSISCRETPIHKFNSEEIKLIERTIKRFPIGTQFSMAFIENGEVTYYGIQNSDDGPEYLNNYSYGFEIGSITKLFTSSILIEAEEEYSFKIEDDVNNYIDIGLPDGITFKNLSNHSSGLPEMPKDFTWENNLENPLVYLDEEFLINFIVNEAKSPLTKNSFLYSNIGVATLGYSLEKITGIEYRDLLNRYILKPYGMKDTVLNYLDYDNKIVPGINNRGDISPNWDFDIMSPAGSIISNVYDLSKFALAHMEVNTLQRTHNKSYDISPMYSMAVGWFITKDSNGNEILTHQGGTNGYSSSISIDPKNKRGLILLTNVSPLRSSYVIGGLVNRLY